MSSIREDIDQAYKLVVSLDNLASNVADVYQSFQELKRLMDERQLAMAGHNVLVCSAWMVMRLQQLVIDLRWLSENIDQWKMNEIKEE